MQISISGQNIELTDALHNYGMEKLGRLKNHVDSITLAHLILKVDNFRHIAEAELHVPGKQLFAKSEEHDMYAAIDTLVDKLDRQLKDYKEKLQE